MGTLYKLLMVLLICMVIVSSAIYLRTGAFWVPRVSLPGALQAPPEMGTLQAPDEPRFKWQQNGRWHYGDQPPAGVEVIAVKATAVDGGADKTDE